jgi:hypothetical protein
MGGAPANVSRMLPPHGPAVHAKRPSKESYFFFLSGRCVNAEPAALLEALPVLPLRNTLDAALPAFAPVFSFFAMAHFPAPTGTNADVP